MATRIIRVGDIAAGSVEAKVEAFKAIAELSSQFELLLAAMDGDSGINLTTYAATYGLTRKIVV